jgi:hypothetical protein
MPDGRADAPVLDAYDLGNGMCAVWCAHCGLWHRHGTSDTLTHVAALACRSVWTCSRPGDGGPRADRRRTHRARDIGADVYDAHDSAHQKEYTIQAIIKAAGQRYDRRKTNCFRGPGCGSWWSSYEREEPGMTPGPPSPTIELSRNDGGEDGGQ